MKVLLGVTGSVAAELLAKIVKRLIVAGHEVKVVASEKGEFFFDHTNIDAEIWRDKDEWPADGYHRGDPVKHIDFTKWAELILLAPLTANTIGEMRCGLGSKFLTCIMLAAWDKPIVIAPAMNTKMWTNPIVQDNLAYLKSKWPIFQIVDPICKNLACGDTGIGAMANIDDIVKVVDSFKL